MANNSLKELTKMRKDVAERLGRATANVRRYTTRMEELDLEISAKKAEMQAEIAEAEAE